MIDTGTLTVTGSVALPATPHALVVARDGRTLYVTLPAAKSLASIGTATLTLSGPPVPVGNSPHGLALDPEGGHAYVTNAASDTVSVVDC